MPKVSFVTTSHTQAMSRLLLIGDGLLISASIPLAYFILKMAKPWIPIIKAPPPPLLYFTLLMLILPAWLFFISRLGLNQIFDRIWKRREMLSGLVKLHVAALIVVTVVLYSTQTFINRSLLSIYFACTFSMLLLERVIIQFRMRYRLRRGNEKKHLLLVGDPGEEMYNFVRSAVASESQTLIVGRIGDPEDASSIAAVETDGFDIPYLGRLEILSEMLHLKAVDQVMFFAPLNDPAASFDALRDCESLGVPACFYVHTPRPMSSIPKLVSVHRYPFFIYEVSPRHPEALVLKNTFDTIAAMAGLILVAPILMIVSVVILITMGRPVFFSQVRSGLFGREFRMHKFRTMVLGAEKQRDELSALNEMDGPVFKIKNDPRITKVGAFLRKWSIDELPQLFNVLTGDMSLVGPRPLPIKEQKDIVGWKRRRLSMRPGITGLWQVSGRNDIDFEQWMKLDLEYIDNWSLREDFKILLKTIIVVITGRGAS